MHKFKKMHLLDIHCVVNVYTVDKYIKYTIRTDINSPLFILQ